MPPPYHPRRQPSIQSSCSNDSHGQRSNDSYGSRSTAPSSLYSSPRPSHLKASPSSETSPAATTAYKRQQVYDPRDDVSPTTSIYPRSTVDTFASTIASCDDVGTLGLAEALDDECDAIPALPVYRRDVVEPNIRASTPQDFAKLFPSLNRFTIRHDEFTPDGNMNLRIDTVVTGRKRTAIQLFHLRMHDLAKREFSLRRYSRDSGREVCNAKLKFTEPKAEPARKLCMSNAIKTLGGGQPVLRRAKSAMSAPGRPSTGYSTCGGEDEPSPLGNSLSRLSLDGRLGRAKAQRPRPTNTIKLEFSNYARVDVNRCGGKGNKRYDFDWWGHRYSWKRSVDKQLGLVSFHLIRDGIRAAPVAHIVPETRSPSQVLADVNAGGWVPPCFMWIADETVVDAVTDVADVIMATGLIALVDDGIRERWQTKKVHRIPVPLTSKTVNFESVSPKAIMQHIFGRRHSNDHPHRPAAPAHPLHCTSPVSAY